MSDEPIPTPWNVGVCECCRCLLRERDEARAEVERLQRWYDDKDRDAQLWMAEALTLRARIAELARLHVLLDRADGALADAWTVPTGDIEAGIRALTRERDEAIDDMHRIHKEKMEIWHKEKETRAEVEQLVRLLVERIGDPLDCGGHDDCDCGSCEPLALVASITEARRSGQKEGE